MNDKQFKQENDDILKFILNDKFFSHFNEKDLPLQEARGLQIEFYITSVCNQKCEYCYLTKHGDELYPKEIRNIDQILHNEELVLQWLLDNNFVLHDLDLFSGEIWGMSFGNRVMSIILKYLKKGLKIKNIMIPSNCSFLLDDKSTAYVQGFIDEYFKYGTHLRFSASVDGQVIETKTRPLKNDSKKENKNTNEFYEKLFNFCLKNSYGYHPMVSYEGIEYWTENYDWWMKYFEKYRLTLDDCIMFLEVRNDGWTEEKIKHFLKFMNHAFDYIFYKICDGDVDTIIKNDIFHVDSRPRNYNVVNLNLSGKKPACTIGRSLTIRLGDLAICPCHRLSYKQFLYGNFVVKNDKIVDIEAKNIQMANKIFYVNTTNQHKCDCCKYNKICMKGCFGAQFECTKDPFLPCDSVCNLIQAKINFLITKYIDTGILKRLKEISIETSNRYGIDFYNALIDIIETKEYKTWKERYLN